MSESNFDEKIRALFGGGTTYKTNVNEDSEMNETTASGSDNMNVLENLNFTLNNEENDDTESSDVNKDPFSEIVYEGELVTESLMDSRDIPEGAKYRTKQVASMLNVPEQTLRNITTLFEDCLPKIERTESGQRLFSKADIERLRKIFQLKTEKNMTYAQIKDFIDKDSGKVIMAMTEEEKTAALITAITNQLQLSMQEQLTSVANLLVDEIRESGRGQHDLLHDLLLEADNANNSKKEQYLHEIQRLEEKLDERDKQMVLLQAELSQIREENAQKNQLILEKLEKKRFGLFRK